MKEANLKRQPMFLMHASSVAQSCLTLCSAIDCSPPGCSVQGICRASMLEWAVISSFTWSSRLGDWTCVSCSSFTGRWTLYHRVPGKPILSYNWSQLYEILEKVSLWRQYKDQTSGFRRWEGGTHGQSTGNIQSSESILCDTIIVIHDIIHLAKPTELYNTKNEPSCKLWNLVNKKVLILVHQLNKCATSCKILVTG